MSDVALTMRQTAFNLRGGLRNARAVVFTIVMPVVLLVLFNSVFSGSNGTTTFDGATIDFAAYFTPGIIAYAIMLSGFNGLLIALTTNRERGLLKRYRGTPMPPWVFLSAQILQTVVTMLVMAAVIVAIGWAFYDVHPQRDALGGVRAVRAARERHDVRARDRVHPHHDHPPTPRRRSARSPP